MEIFALFMFVGIFTSLLIPETKRKTLEQLAGEVPGTPEYDPDLAGRRQALEQTVHPNYADTVENRNRNEKINGDSAV